MNNEYFNTVTLQTRSLVELSSIQADKSFDKEKLNEIMSEEEFINLGKVIITGCGDSYSAAGAMRSAFEELSGVKTYSPDPMDFTAFYSDRDILNLEDLELNGSLVIAISSSGGGDRIEKILARGNEVGAKTLLLTNNPKSKNVAISDSTFVVETPPLNDVPGVRSYLASMSGILALGAHIGVLKGHLLESDFEDLKEEMIKYIESCDAYYPAMESLALETALEWKDFVKFEAIGDGWDYFTAQFVEQKLIECAGHQITHADSEDWSHVNIFMKQPETIGTVVHAFTNQPSFSRLVETTNSAAKLGRPILLVTDAKDANFHENVKVSLMPSSPDKYPWLSSLYSYVPGSLISGYLASVVGKLFFGGRYDYNKQEWLVKLGGLDEVGKKDEK